MTIDICNAPLNTLLWSRTASRTPAFLFEDTVFDQEDGEIWVFAAAKSDVDQIDFTVSGTAFDVTLFEDERRCPYDVRGSDISNNDPGPIDLRELGTGTFVVEAKIYDDDGSTETIQFTAFVAD